MSDKSFFGVGSAHWPRHILRASPQQKIFFFFVSRACLEGKKCVGYVILQQDSAAQCVFVGSSIRCRKQKKKKHLNLFQIIPHKKNRCVGTSLPQASEVFWLWLDKRGNSSSERQRSKALIMLIPRKPGKINVNSIVLSKPDTSATFSHGFFVFVRVCVGRKGEREVE